MYTARSFYIIFGVFMVLQLDFFKELNDVEIMENEIKEMKKSQEKMRKSLFAKHGALCKQYMDLSDRFEILERVLCKGKFGAF
jgi:hypothetical protein